MGCFSWLCSRCGKPINSDSIHGQECVLAFVHNGKVIEWMAGQYDSYGRVFDGKGESVEWKNDWQDMVDAMYDNSQPDSGMMAYHQRCLPNKPIVDLPIRLSDSDPRQGWGSFKAKGYSEGELGHSVVAYVLTGEDRERKNQEIAMAELRKAEGDMVSALWRYNRVFEKKISSVSFSYNKTNDAWSAKREESA
jgi:hypothetical protein